MFLLTYWDRAVDRASPWIKCSIELVTNEMDRILASNGTRKAFMVEKYWCVHLKDSCSRFELARHSTFKQPKRRQELYSLSMMDR